MALWEAPITATVTDSEDERILASKGGLRAGSKPISGMETGRGPVVGVDPVQRTRRLEEMVFGSGNFSSGELILTVQFPDCLMLGYEMVFW